MNNPRVRAAALAVLFVGGGCVARAPELDAPGGLPPGAGSPQPLPGVSDAVDFGEPNQPVFGPTVTQPAAPPAISGGTLTMLHDGNTAVASDPDRDHIYVVDVAAATKLADFTLQVGDEPGRVVEDAAGRVHVALRSGGAVVTIDPATWTITSRQSVCPAPRGLVYDATPDLVHVACAGGELVSLPAGGGAATRTLQLGRDLRDVAVLDGKLYVSRFRTAQLIPIGADGTPGTPLVPAEFDTVATPGIDTSAQFTPGAAWRLFVLPAQHTIYMLHQRGTTSVIDTTQPGGYGNGDTCGSAIVHDTITAFTPTGATAVPGPVLEGATLAVDFAYSPTSDAFAVVSAGNAKVPNSDTITYTPRTPLSTTCDGTSGPSPVPTTSEPIAVAYTLSGQLVVQSREPATLYLPQTNITIFLSSDSKADTGHAIFHANAGGAVACASCHLEGGEDGRIWTFDTVGPRRTQAIRGGISGTEPFHWDGSEKDFAQIMTDVFVHRMSGPALPVDQQSALSSWVDQIPLLLQSPPPDAGAVTRGEALFEDATNVGCTTCHTGDKMTDNATVDVGTGAAFQVPGLHGVGWRDPYLHDGRATTLTDRFTPSIGGGDTHGHTSQLTPSQISDLVAYLESI